MNNSFIPELKWIAWESTKQCNLSCIHCRSSSSIKEKSFLDTKQAFLLMDKIALSAKPVFVLSGGEPLLREDIFDIASYGKNLGFKMAMATNGTLLNDEKCKKIKDSGIEIVSISLDGPDNKTHDSFRNQDGAFKKILNGIEILKKNNIEFIINSSFTKKNQDKIKETYEFVKTLKPKAWYMFMVVPMGRGQNIDLIEQKDYEEILKWHLMMEENEKEMLVRPTCAPSYYRLKIEAEKKNLITKKTRNLTFSPGGKKGCIAGQNILYIDAYGNVYPCSYFPLSAGNIYEKSLKEIWDSKLFSDLRGNYHGRCGKCEYVNICGGCRARSYYDSNDYLSSDPYCLYEGKK